MWPFLVFKAFSRKFINYSLMRQEKQNEPEEDSCYHRKQWYHELKIKIPPISSSCFWKTFPSLPSPWKVLWSHIYNWTPSIPIQTVPVVLLLYSYHCNQHPLTWFPLCTSLFSIPNKFYFFPHNLFFPSNILLHVRRKNPQSSMKKGRIPSTAAWKNKKDSKYDK